MKYDINGLAAGTIFHYESLKINKLKNKLFDIGCNIESNSSMKIGIINSNTSNVENVIKSIKYLGFEPTMIEEKNQLSIIPFNNTWG